MKMPLAKYLARIGLSQQPSLDVKGLYQIHLAQFFSIPFENLDIHLGREISLKPQRILQKILDEKRGGYCFELNALLLMALHALGFQARSILARVHLGQDEPGGRTHQICAITLGNRLWISDVGFGAGGPRVPLALQSEIEIAMPYVAYRFKKHPHFGWILETKEDSLWKQRYSFDLGYVHQNDLELGNFFTSHSPNTHFTQIKTVSLPTSTGRISLRDNVLTTLKNGMIKKEYVPDEQAFVQLLEAKFGIEIQQPFKGFKAPFALGKQDKK